RHHATKHRIPPFGGLGSGTETSAVPHHRQYTLLIGRRCVNPSRTGPRRLADASSAVVEAALRLRDPDDAARPHRPAVPHRLRERAPQLARGYGFQNPCDGMRNARLKREDAFSHAMIIVSSAMVSSS